MNKDIYFDLVLGVVGIIEGLALSKLAETTSNFIFETEKHSTGRFLNIILCFVIIIRIFQGFIAGSLDPIKKEDLQIQLIIAFLFGLVQYGMIDAVDRVDGGLVVYKLAAVVATLGAISHAWNRYDLITPTIEQINKLNYGYETRFQELSCFAMILAAVSLVYAGYSASPNLAQWISAGAVILLVFNIYLSFELLRFNLRTSDKIYIPKLLSKISKIYPESPPPNNV